MKIISLFFLIGLGSLSAQSFTGKLNYFPQSHPKLISSQDTVRILAVMVDFQQDDDANTYGNGKFGSIYSKNYGNTIIDPPPFNADYFSNHLEFAKNYFRKVSNGKLNISYNILPNVITVSKIMREYSPPPTAPNQLTNLGTFVQEVWQLVSQQNPSFDFSRYDLFVVFHAGVGRDIQLPGSLGTERDLPSVYLGLRSLQSIFGEQFDGFPISGNFKIRNTVILPSTESREVEQLNTTVLFQMSINGLIVASIGSYLGLPDLFNTETGRSAIGRFGLMDGASIFAYSGAFPPEPSAWEKIYLGWLEPVTVNIPSAEKNINLVARLAGNLSDTTILKIPINSTEYFLIENRQRDVNKDGSIVSYIINGQTLQFRSTTDQQGYEWFAADTLKGVVTDVDEFDWAVPGQIDDTSHYTGGIVIWHIDENVIANKISDNKINTDIYHRGVSVVEADGIPDIGQLFTDIFGEQVEGQATYEDMWYKGNPAKFYTNKFGPNTKPNSMSYSGANSLITLYDFSVSSNKMSFKLSFSDSNLILRAGTKLNLSGKLNAIVAPFNGTGDHLYLMTGNILAKIDNSGNLIKTFDDFSNRYPAAVQVGNIEYVVGSLNGKLSLLISDGLIDNLKTYDLTSQAASPITLNENNNRWYIIFGTQDGNIVKTDLEDLANKAELTSADYTKVSDQPVLQVCSSPGDTYFSFITLHTFSDANKARINFSAELKKCALSKDADGSYANIVLAGDNTFFVIQNGIVATLFNIRTDSAVSDFSVANLFDDGSNYILFNNGSKLEAYNLEGAKADFFPFTEPSNSNFTGLPLTIKFGDQSRNYILAFAENGNIYAVNPATGKTVLPFPLSTGISVSTVPILYRYLLTSFPPTDQTLLSLVDDSNNFYTWSLGKYSEANIWAGKFSNSLNNSFAEAAGRSNQPTDFFPSERAYNWPNPVYGNRTNIRYYVAEDSNVRIKIFDLGGDLVADLTDNAAGGFDHDTIWDVSNVQSGIYFAHLEVTSASGKTASKIIKVAVVK